MIVALQWASNTPLDNAYAVRSRASGGCIKMLCLIDRRRSATRTSWVACAERRWPRARDALRRAMSSQVRDSPMGRETSFNARPAMPASSASISGGVSSWSQMRRPGIGWAA